MDFTTYLRSLQKDLSSGKATEHTYRPALKTLVESVQRGVRATNEPKREECGAPDFIVQRRDIPLGYIECKDIGKPLDQEEKSEQMERYRPALANLILTDYLEFRYYVQGERKLTARLGTVDRKGKIRPDAPGQADVLQLLDTFLAAEWPAINKPRELAARMAKLAQLIRRTILAALEHESQRGKLHQQMKGFRDVLLHDLTQDQFADMYAQTICYGLFAAWCNTPPKEVDKFTREHAAYALPKTNPFLRSMFSHIAGPELPPSITWVVDDVAELLRRADIGAILKDFGKRTRREDPVVHFYETFLAEYDRKMRESRGVYYTPDPVVSYIVRSIDHILKTDFDVKDGLADASVIKKDFPIPGTHERETREVHKVQILDPATGTGTFLYGVILQIYQTFRRNRGLWPGYVSKHLLPRLFGFELLMAPYAIAHMKLDLLLKDTGYDFPADERINVFLTNTLEEAEYKAAGLFAGLIAEEANQASSVKKDIPVMVVLGNPPYSGHSANRNEVERVIEPFQEYTVQTKKGQVRRKAGKSGKILKEKTSIGRLIQDYFLVDGKPLGERNPKWLNDDYVKFIRFAQHRIERTGHGIVAFISNNGYLDNPTFRGMRQHLMKSFDDIYVVDLHGSSKKKEVCPGGAKDENVFDIQQGVTIGIFVRRRTRNEEVVFHHADCYGTRAAKYAWLSNNDVASTEWTRVAPTTPFYLFVPQDMKLRQEYDAMCPISEALPVNVLGFQTHRDHFAIDFEVKTLRDRILEMREANLSDEGYAQKYGLRDSSDWNLADARTTIRKDPRWEDSLIPCLYRPFDWRACCFRRAAMDRPRGELEQHVARRENITLGVGRQGLAVNDPQWALVSVSRVPTDANIFRRGGINLFPLYLFATPGKLIPAPQHWPPGKEGRRPNLNPDFVSEFANCLNLQFVSDGAGDLKTNFGPEDIFHYMYAVFHSPTYRTRYADFLKIDFPRVPVTSDKKLFRALCALGKELVGLHLLEEVPEPTASYPVPGDSVVEKPQYVPPQAEGDAHGGRVKINGKQYFEPVAPEVWEFHIGGYQVCKKWLKDRKGRELTYDDINHYRNIVTALSETIRLMAEIDKAIPKWPIE